MGCCHIAVVPARLFGLNIFPAGTYRGQHFACLRHGRESFFEHYLVHFKSGSFTFFESFHCHESFRVRFPQLPDKRSSPLIRRFYDNLVFDNFFFFHQGSPDGLTEYDLPAFDSQRRLDRSTSLSVQQRWRPCVSMIWAPPVSLERPFEKERHLSLTCDLLAPQPRLQPASPLLVVV